MTTTTHNVNSGEAITALVAAEGDLDLAAEILFGVWDPKSTDVHPKSRLIAIIADDPTAQADLQRQLRTLTILETFNTTRKVGLVVEGTLDKLQASERAKLYTQLLGVLSSLTDEHASSFNANIQSTSLSVTEAIFSHLPPEIRDTLKVLMAGPTPKGFSGSEVDVLDSKIWSIGDTPPNAALGNGRHETGQAH